MNPDGWRALLDDLEGLLPGAGVLEDIRRVFLPLPHHTLALRPDTGLILGKRGAGKTALFQFLMSFREEPTLLAGIFPDARLPRLILIDGFHEMRMEHPSDAALDVFARRDDETLRVLWAAHLACRLIKAGVREAGPLSRLFTSWEADVNDLDTWVQHARGDLAALLEWLDALDRQLRHERRTVFIAYDHLDRIRLPTRGARERYAATLVALWGSLTPRYHHLRPKIFLREDLFAAAQRSSPEASRLGTTSISLDWDTESLFRVLIRAMAALSERTRAWITSGPKGIPLEEHDVLGWMPLGSLPDTGPVSQKTFAAHMAGGLMVTGFIRAFTYRWIANRLKDAHGRIVPRSLLNLVAYAAGSARDSEGRARGDQLLMPRDLVNALPATSLGRIMELQEEHQVVARLANLRGQTLLLDRGEVERLLAHPAETQDDGFGHDGARVTEELSRLGVLTIRHDGLVDIPDIYRHGYGIRRMPGATSRR